MVDMNKNSPHTIKLQVGLEITSFHKLLRFNANGQQKSCVISVTLE